MLCCDPPFEPSKSSPLAVLLPQHHLNRSNLALSRGLIVAPCRWKATPTTVIFFSRTPSVRRAVCRNHRLAVWRVADAVNASATRRACTCVCAASLVETQGLQPPVWLGVTECRGITSWITPIQNRAGADAGGLGLGMGLVLVVLVLYWCAMLCDCYTDESQLAFQTWFFSIQKLSGWMFQCLRWRVRASGGGDHWAPRTRKRHQQEHRPQRPTERSDPTQHAKGRTCDCPGPCKGATTGRNVTHGAPCAACCADFASTHNTHVTAHMSPFGGGGGGHMEIAILIVRSCLPPPLLALPWVEGEGGGRRKRRQNPVDHQRIRDRLDGGGQS